MLHLDLLPELLLRTEITQRREEGYDLGDLPQEIEAAIAAGKLETQMEDFWSRMEVLPLPESRSKEPPDLEPIRAARPAGPRRFAIKLDKDLFAEKIYGAWLGRCAGCTLGKPVEGRPRVTIEAYLRKADAYPLSDYFPVLDPFPEGLELAANYVRTTKGNVTHMTRDDDIDYTILGLHILETYGRDFNSRDVALTWIYNLPFYKVYTAEAIAYRNVANGLEPPATARFRNPYREWLGAQIRADMWGYVNPGNPQRAAEFAYRDAAVSHTANGIYGEMWAAASIAAAFATGDLIQIIEAGLSEIPTDCRLAQAIRDTIKWAQIYPTWEQTWEKVNAKYGHYHTVHTINNTCMNVMGLLYGKGDFEKSICTSVMGGWDTDCTGATTGSIVGAILGAKALPEKWIAPLNDRLYSLVPDFQDSIISQLAQRTVALAEMPGK